jgi:molybdate/tungstate transport system permease protein
MKNRSFNAVFIGLSGLLVVFVLLPLLVTLLTSNAEQNSGAMVDEEVFRSLGLTFLAGSIATGLTLISGVPLAYMLARHTFIGKSLVGALVDLPVVIPHTAAGVALLLVFGRRGVLGHLFAQVGIEFTDNLGGIVVAMMFVSLPFLVNMSREAFAAVDKELEQVALTDGASSWQVFSLVTLPLAWRGLVAGAMMMWARGISEFGAVVILAYNPKIVPVLVYERFTGFGLAAAQPVAVILIITALVVFVTLRLILMKDRTDS